MKTNLLIVKGYHSDVHENNLYHHAANQQEMAAKNLYHAANQQEMAARFPFFSPPSHLHDPR